MENRMVSTIDRLDKNIHDNYLNQHSQKHTPFDTFLKWSPLTVLFFCDVAGLKTKSSYKKQVAQAVVGNILLNIAIQPLKKSVKRIRPNGHQDSFPSSHAATSFFTSEILREELKENSTVLKNSGYVLSLVTCGLRLYHNKHWLSDVVGGALIGAIIGKVSTRLFEQRPQESPNHASLNK